VIRCIDVISRLRASNDGVSVVSESINAVPRSDTTPPLVSGLSVVGDNGLTQL
jgi:hypothetical protein